MAMMSRCKTCNIVFSPKFGHDCKAKSTELELLYTQLAAVTAARNEACDGWASHVAHQLRPQDLAAQKRIAELRAVGGAK